MISQPRIDINGPANPMAVFDPPVVRPGELSVYRVTLNALEQTIQWPKELAAPPQLEMRPGAHGEILRMAGPSLVPLSAFNYRARASTTGQFTVPQFVVQVYGKSVTIPAARLEVVSLPPASPSAAPHLILEVPVTNLFVGQAARASARVAGPPGGMPQGLGQVQFIGEGFIVDQGAAGQRIESASRNGTNITTFIHETMITPVEAGKRTLFAQAFTMSPIIFSGPAAPPATMPGGPLHYTLLESDPVEFVARPLPLDGRLPGFTGAIGRFAVDPPALPTSVLRVGDPVRLIITVRGGTNLSRLVPPPPPRVNDWQVLAASADGTPPQLVQARGFVSFSYTLVPLNERTRATPAIPFSCFDPESATYADLTIPAVPVTVQPRALAADLRPLLQPPSSAGEAENELRLSGLAASPGRAAARLVPLQQHAWFPLLHLVPAGTFLGLWGWDRRRRYLEKHPDIILRRRARRALHREWRALRRAARDGDAPRFAATAVSAMRVACAPHYPAEPRALVGSDVLQLLDEPAHQEPLEEGRLLPFDERARRIVTLSPAVSRAEAQREERRQPLSNHATEVVRRFFAVTDASRFAAAPSDATELLRFQPELEQVLAELEARL